jgi:hypothetical protein
VPAQSWPPFAASELPTVADATDDFALPGPSGKRVGELLADAIRVGQKTLADILGPAVARLLQESPLNIAGLFDDGEREKLRAAFEASSTAADLLGRSRIVLHAAKFDAKGKAQFADADPLSVFAEPLPSLSSRRALGTPSRSPKRPKKGCSSGSRRHSRSTSVPTGSGAGPRRKRRRSPELASCSRYSIKWG